ncbi:hypothetical protein [Acidisphaera rubrifaciens]|nr:hypothetical protein [Acidisphaera rubrifaciens]
MKTPPPARLLAAALPIILPLALGACAHHRPATTPVAGTRPVPRTGGPDGGWSGTSTRFQADSRSCPNPGLVSTQVFDRQFQLRWGNRGSDLSASIQPDGSIIGGAGDVTLSGKYTAERITVDATTDACGLHYTLHRSN